MSVGIHILLRYGITSYKSGDVLFYYIGHARGVFIYILNPTGFRMM